MKFFWSKEVKIGLITLICLVLLFFGFNYLKGINVLKPSNLIVTTLPEVTGLSISTPVRINGYQVGVVHQITYNYEENKDFKVSINMDNKVLLPKGSKIVMSIGLMGGAELNIIPGPPTGEFEPKNAVLPGVVSAGLMGEIQNTVLPQLEEMVPKIDSILNGINQIVSSPAIAQSLKNLEQTTSSLQKSTRELDHFMQNDFKPIAGNIKKLSYDLTELSANINKMPLNSMVNNLDVTIKNLETTSKQLTTKDNNIGLLLNDRTLYDNLSTMLTSANNLMVDFKANPKRYAHFSLFGKK